VILVSDVKSKAMQFLKQVACWQGDQIRLLKTAQDVAPTHFYVKINTSIIMKKEAKKLGNIFGIFF
jgi:hypothetical protein